MSNCKKIVHYKTWCKQMCVTDTLSARAHTRFQPPLFVRCDSSGCHAKINKIVHAATKNTPPPRLKFAFMMFIFLEIIYHFNLQQIAKKIFSVKRDRPSARSKTIDLRLQPRAVTDDATGSLSLKCTHTHSHQASHLK